LYWLHKSPPTPVDKDSKRVSEQKGYGDKIFYLLPRIVSHWKAGNWMELCFTLRITADPNVNVFYSDSITSLQRMISVSA
jgi:hypothetical protein